MKPPRIVFIDDQPAALRYYIRALEDKGYEITILSSSDAAWEFFGEPRDDVKAVILDVMMPEGSHVKDPSHGMATGIYLIRRILMQEVVHKRSKTNIPIAVLTNRNIREVMDDVRTLVGNEYVSNLKVWSKLDFSDPFEFGNVFSKWLSSVSKN